MRTTAQESPALSYLSLFRSFGTILCCALPSLLVLLGFGATVATVLSSAPWLVALSRHKGWVFAVLGTLIAGNLVYIYLLSPRLRAQGVACSVGAPEACDTASRVSRVLLWVSAALYAVGLFSAYLLGPILIRLIHRDHPYP